MSQWPGFAASGLARLRAWITSSHFVFTAANKDHDDRNPKPQRAGLLRELCCTSFSLDDSLLRLDARV